MAYSRICYDCERGPPEMLDMLDISYGQKSNTFSQIGNQYTY